MGSSRPRCAREGAAAREAQRGAQVMAKSAAQVTSQTGAAEADPSPDPWRVEHVVAALTSVWVATDAAGRVCATAFEDVAPIHAHASRCGARLTAGGGPHSQAATQVAEYLAGHRADFTVDVRFLGTPFQVAAWSALRSIPFGEVRSYADQARAIGRPTALRAVGAANGRNPIPLIAPCHRVIATGGGLGGFAGGLALKQRLLAHEAKHARPGREPPHPHAFGPLFAR